ADDDCLRAAGAGRGPIEVGILGGITLLDVARIDGLPLVDTRLGRGVGTRVRDHATSDVDSGGKDGGAGAVASGVVEGVGHRAGGVDRLPAEGGRILNLGARIDGATIGDRVAGG